MSLNISVLAFDDKISVSILYPFCIQTSGNLFSEHAFIIVRKQYYGTTCSYYRILAITTV